MVFINVITFWIKLQNYTKFNYSPCLLMTLLPS